MSSAWGNSWGKAWGNSWGNIAPLVVVDTHDGFNDKKSAKRFINKDWQEIRAIIEQSVYGTLGVETEKEIEFVAKRAIIENQFDVSKEQVNAIVADIYAMIAARKAKAELDELRKQDKPYLLQLYWTEHEEFRAEHPAHPAYIRCQSGADEPENYSREPYDGVQFLPEDEIEEREIWHGPSGIQAESVEQGIPRNFEEERGDLSDEDLKTQGMEKAGLKNVW
jgi:hypothetical protein